MDEKKAFLANIRTSLGHAAEEARDARLCLDAFADEDMLMVLDRVRNRTHAEKQALLQVLRENAASLRLDVHVVPALEQAAEVIVSIIGAVEPEFSDTKQVVQHDHADLIGLQLWKRLSREGVQVHTTYLVDGDVRDKSVVSCVGLTAPRWAVADSATLVQLTEPGRPRSTSLLPSVHISLLRLQDIVADLGEVYALLSAAPPPASFLFITGSSKTADIEAHMVPGAHGPRHSHLVVIDEQMAVPAPVAEDGPLRGSGLSPA